MKRFHAARPLRRLAAAQILELLKGMMGATRIMWDPESEMVFKV